ncbi:unannotated protein [freshwater metagenome]|uniref:Unannotated protein n=1 Tax=freshwater metagenome TaxID=449393 RepID=A0A6J7HXK2_9ZZZZ|nr:DUF3883 domain-containing protein [Actinomycetota bacterium]
MSTEDEAASYLADTSHAVTPDALLAARDPHLQSAGLYAWWVDKEGAALLSQGVGHAVEAGLIYVGQAGATQWPSGKQSGSTLWKRLSRDHLGKRATKSTLRRLLGSLRASAFSHREVDEAELTQWMQDHLQVSTFPVEDRDGLKKLETSVLVALDPPLNVDEMPPTALRVEAKRLRSSFFGANAPHTHAPIVGNHKVEAAAIHWVLVYERGQGREARDSRHQGEAADVISSGRVIEVKAYGGSARGSDLWLEVRQVEEARQNPDFHVYVVENVRQGDPSLFRLIDLHGETLAQLLERATEQHYYTVPLPVAVYDAVRGQSEPN